MPSVSELLGRFRGRGGSATPRHHELQQQQQEVEERARRASARLRMERYNMSAGAIRNKHQNNASFESRGSSSSSSNSRSSRESFGEYPSSQERQSKRRSIEFRIDISPKHSSDPAQNEIDSDRENAQPHQYSRSHHNSHHRSSSRNNTRERHKSRSRSRQRHRSRNKRQGSSRALRNQQQQMRRNDKSQSLNTDNNSDEPESLHSALEQLHVSTPRNTRYLTNGGSLNEPDALLSLTYREASGRQTGTDVQHDDQGVRSESDVEHQPKSGRRGSSRRHQNHSEEDPGTTRSGRSHRRTPSGQQKDRHRTSRSRERRHGTSGKNKNKSRSKSRERKAIALIQKRYGDLQDSVSSLPKLKELIEHEDSDVLLFATRKIRKLLSIAEHAPIAEVVERGFLPHLIRLLSRDDHPSLQLQAAWAITNVASGASEFTVKVVECGALKPLLRLVLSANPSIREQAVWAIGNITGDSSALRDTVLEHGIVDNLIRCAKLKPLKTSLQKNIAWTISNLCRGKPQPNLYSVAPMLPTLKELLESDDEEVLTDGCWAMAYMSDGDPDRAQVLLDAGCQALIAQKLLTHRSPWIVAPSLRTVGNIVTGDQDQTQILLDLGVLGGLHKLLKSTNFTKLRTEACWAISNITAGNEKQIQLVLDEGIVQDLVECSKESSTAVAKESTWALANACTAGDIKQRSFLVNAGVIEVLTRALLCTDWQEQSRFMGVLLEATGNVLAAGVNLDRTPGESTFARKMRNTGLFSLLSNGFRDATSEPELREKADEIIEKYFDSDLEVVLHHPTAIKPVPSHWVDPDAYAAGNSELLSLAERRAAARREFAARSETPRVSNNSPSSIPAQFYCPIAQDLMIDPVLTLDGQTYDRYNIQRWFGEGNNTSPATGKELKSLALIPNQALRQMIEELEPGYTWQADLDGEWTCESCTFGNIAFDAVCSACLYPRPHPRPKVVERVQN